jgi:WD40 repeat protein
MLAVAWKDKSIRIWSLATGKEIAALKGHTGNVRCLSLSPDGRTLASGSDDRTIKLWDLASLLKSETAK